MTAYTDFVKANFHKLPATMKATDKMRSLGAAWRKMKADAGTPIAPRKARKPRARKTKGAGIGSDVGQVVDSLGSLLGFGLKKKRTRKTKGGGIGSDVGHVVDSLGSLLGFGLKKKRTRKAKH